MPHPSVPVSVQAALLTALLAALLLPAGAAADEFPPAPFAGYRLLEVSYLLRAPDGALVRVTRQAPTGAAQTETWRPGAPGPGLPAGALQRIVWPLTSTPAPAGQPSNAPPSTAPAEQPGWFGAWWFGVPRLYTEMSDYVRETWTLILRLRDLLGVVVLVAASWVLWFLVRPSLLLLSDRQVFLLAFAAMSGLWFYTTGLYTSVLYALGLMLAPALVIAVLSFVLRRAWALLRPAPAAGAPPAA